MKLTAAQVDLLQVSTERPQPITIRRDGLGRPVNPLVLMAEWGGSVSLTTRWLTDVTKPIGGRRQAMILSSRPVRSQRITMVADTKEKATAMQAAMLDYATYSGAPVPIYCDAVKVDSVDLIGGVIYGNFARRRFFAGGRCIFVAPIDKADQFSVSSFYATISEVGANYLKVELDPASFRLITSSDYVMPCFDCELVVDSQIEMKTDSVHVISVRWNELEGLNCLPGLWPAVSPSDGSIVSPIAQVIDNKPVWPFEPNWADPVVANPTREVDTDESGRGTVLEARGPAFLKFTMTVCGYDRERVWSVLRFFDAMRGRAGVFWFVHPSRPWKTSGLTSTSVQVSASGNPSSFAEHYKKVAFIRQDKTIEIRSISFVTYQGGSFDVQFSPALPDTNFIDAQPVYLASFDSDSLEEVWANDEVVPSMSFTINEEKDYGTVSIGTTMGYQEGFPGIYAIQNPSFLVRAGIGHTWDNARSYVWPANNHRVFDWADISYGPSRSNTPPRVMKRMSSIPPLYCGLFRFFDSNINNGQSALASPVMSMNHLYDNNVQDGDKHIWGSQGFTMFLCFTPHEVLGASDKLLFRVQAGGAGIRFYYDRAGQTGAACHQIGILEPGSGIWRSANLTIPIADKLTACCLTIRVDNNENKTRVWLNGSNALASSLLASLQVPPPGSIYSDEWFSAFYVNQLMSSGFIMQAFGKYGSVSFLSCYPRPLSLEEIKTMQVVLSNQYKIPIGATSLYA